MIYSRYKITVVRVMPHRFLQEGERKAEVNPKRAIIVATPENNYINVPDSFVQSSCLLISASVTVGRTLDSDFKKSANFSGGSNSSSESTSDHDFSTAFGSPGEHGVHLSGTSGFEDGMHLKC